MRRCLDAEQKLATALELLRDTESSSAQPPRRRENERLRTRLKEMQRDRAAAATESNETGKMIKSKQSWTDEVTVLEGWKLDAALGSAAVCSGSTSCFEC